MTFVNETDFLYEVAAGRVSGKGQVRVFGENNGIGTTSEDIVSAGGVYPWPTSASTLEAISTNAGDDSAGVGARTILVQGLDVNFDEISELITMNGTSATTATTAEFMRINCVLVASAGTYALGDTDGSNNGTITIRVSGAGDTLATILNTQGNGRNSDFIYTVPAGKQLLVKQVIVDIDANKDANVRYWVRPNADIVAAPFSPKFLVYEQHGLTGGAPLITPQDLPFTVDEKSDLWINADFISGTGDIICNADGILEDKP